MKSLLCITLAIICSQSLCDADVFVLPRMYDAKSKTWHEREGVRAKLIEKVGVDPVVNSARPGKEEFEVIYGRLLGVREGESVGSTERGITNDEIRVQVLSADGKELGKPIRSTVIDLHPIPYLQTIDTLWDLERIYGSISRSFETQTGSPLFEATLMGILDPTGEMGLNTLQAKVNLPDDFTHGWLTHYASFGMENEYSTTDIYSLDAINSFSYLFVQNRVIKLIDDLALDAKFGIYEDGVREEVTRFISLLYRLREVDPARVSDPKLAERAKRLKALGRQTEWLLVQCMHADSHHAVQHTTTRDRLVTAQERANAMLEVIERHPETFVLLTGRAMTDILNAGQNGRNAVRYPHPDCAEKSLGIFFNFLNTPQMTGSRERKRLVRDAAAIRRRAFWSGMIPGGINDNAAFAARCRSEYKRLGYGTTAEIKDLVDSLDARIPGAYMAEPLYDKAGGIPTLSLEFNEVLSPDNRENEQPSKSGISQGSLSDEEFLHTALDILKDIAFSLPQNAVGRANKAALVENWRQRQLDLLEESLKNAIRFEGDPPPELSPKQKYFKRQLTEQWSQDQERVQP